MSKPGILYRVCLCDKGPGLAVCLKYEVKEKSLMFSHALEGPLEGKKKDLLQSLSADDSVSYRYLNKQEHEPLVAALGTEFPDKKKGFTIETINEVSIAVDMNEESTTTTHFLVFEKPSHMKKVVEMFGVKETSKSAKEESSEEDAPLPPVKEDKKDKPSPSVSPDLPPTPKDKRKLKHLLRSTNGGEGLSTSCIEFGGDSKEEPEKKADSDKLEGCDRIILSHGGKTRAKRNAKSPSPGETSLQLASAEPIEEEDGDDDDGKEKKKGSPLVEGKESPKARVRPGTKHKAKKGISATLRSTYSQSCVSLGVDEPEEKETVRKKKKKVVSKDDSVKLGGKSSILDPVVASPKAKQKKKRHSLGLSSGDKDKTSSSPDEDKQKSEVKELAEVDIVNNAMDEEELKIAQERLFGSKIDCPYGIGLSKKDKRDSIRKEIARKAILRITPSSSDSLSSQSISLSESSDDTRSLSPAPGSGKLKEGGMGGRRKTSLVYPPVPENLRYWDSDDMFNVHLNEFSRDDRILSVYSAQVDVISLDCTPSPKTPEELFKQNKVAFQPCAIALSAFMILGVAYRGRRLFLKRHLWDLKEVSSVPESGSLLLTFNDNRTCLLFVPSPQNVVDGLLNSLQNIQDKAYFPKINAPLQNRLRKTVSQSTSDESEDGCGLDTTVLFQSFCAHDSVPFNEQAQALLADFAKRRDRHLDLTCICKQQDCALCAAKDRKEAVPSVLTPAEYALRFLERDRHFVRVSCSGNTSVGATKALSNAINNHSRLKSITLIDCPDEERYVMDFLTSLCDAKAFLCLDRLILKSCDLGEKGFRQLGTAIFGTNAVWKELVVDDCGGTPKAVATLLEEMGRKAVCFKELQVLSLARNKMEEMGTEALNSFFDKLNTVCGLFEMTPSLLRLDLSETRFVPPLLDKVSLLVNLEELNLSGCLFGNKGAETFSSVFRNLKRLHVKDMQLGSDETMFRILSSFGKESKEDDCLMLDFGVTDNDTSSLSDKRKIKKALSVLDSHVTDGESGSAKSRTSALSKLPFNAFPVLMMESNVSKALVSLELVGVIMNSACVKALSTKYESKTVLQRLCIKDLPSPCITEPKEWGEAICSVVENIKSLRSAEFSYGFSTEILQPMLDLLSKKKKKTLVSLNIAGNHMGKEGLKLIDALISSCPSYLHELYIQDNDFDMNDLKTLKKSLSSNKSITHFYYATPMHLDSDMSTKEAKEVKSRMKEIDEFDESLKPIVQETFDSFEKKQFSGFFPDNTDLPDLQIRLRTAQFGKFVSLLPPCECSVPK